MTLLPENIRQKTIRGRTEWLRLDGRARGPGTGAGILPLRANVTAMAGLIQGVRRALAKRLSITGYAAIGQLAWRGGMGRHVSYGLPG
jgi:hypothetical protein